jgi:adenine-specific DNA methylase
MTDSWDKLPLNLMDDMAKRESYNRYHYRPIYSLHKWWARRPGATFRTLGLACLTDENTSKDDILKMNQSGIYEGQYLQHQEDKFSDKTVLDPFAGGGTTLVELNRLGANTIGYELNPVAWWTIKKSIDEVDLSRLREEFENLLQDVREELDEYYTTEDPDTGKQGEILFTFKAQTIECNTCEENVRLFKNYRLAKARKTIDGAVYCPNQDCDDRVITFDRDIKDSETCPSCGQTFDPSDGNYSRGKYTCSNGHKHDVRETLQREGEKPQFEDFVIQYQTPGGEKKFKEVDEEDRRNVQNAKETWDDFEPTVFPQQEIPDGYNTRQIKNWNYDYFHELFTDRQLLIFSKAFERALEIDNQNLREFVITALSRSLEYNSILCRWEYNYQRATSIFERHIYMPKVQPVVGNPLNREDNLSSFTSAFRKVYDAKEYCEEPFEKMKENGSVNKYEIQNESISEDRLENLACATSEHIDREDGSVDYIITDPPYYDNVQYSELSDYFYVWLSECLSDDYEEFQSELVPKAREIVANEKVGKSEDFFIESLSNVFTECHRVLDSDGEMVFTYHHNENEAWSVILEAIIESGFTVTGAYPVQSETDNNMHITDLDNTEYDILIYANKEQVEEEITLTELRQNLFFELQDMAAEERERHEDLSKADLGVILRGKCMYYYSRHYPDIYSEGEKAGIDEALDTVDSIIEQVLEGSVNLPASVDPLSEAYAAFIQRGSEAYDDLNKQLLAKNLNVSDMEDENLVRGPREKKEPVTADARVTYIESKLNSNGSDPVQSELNGGETDNEALLDIDKVHYLYHLYKTDQNTIDYLKEWKTDDLEELAGFMADVTGDERYENVMEMGITQF